MNQYCAWILSATDQGSNWILVELNRFTTFSLKTEENKLIWCEGCKESGELSLWFLSSLCSRLHVSLTSLCNITVSCVCDCSCVCMCVCPETGSALNSEWIIGWWSGALRGQKGGIFSPKSIFLCVGLKFLHFHVLFQERFWKSD